MLTAGVLYIRPDGTLVRLVTVARTTGPFGTEQAVYQDVETGESFVVPLEVFAAEVVRPVGVSEPGAGTWFWYKARVDSNEWSVGQVRDGQFYTMRRLAQPMDGHYVRNLVTWGPKILPPIE